MCTLHVPGAQRDQKRILDHLEFTGLVAIVPCEYGESNWSPLQEQSVLLITEPLTSLYFF